MRCVLKWFTIGTLVYLFLGCSLSIGSYVMYVFVCAHTRICVYVHVLYVCVCACVCLCARVYVCMYVCVCVLGYRLRKQ